MLDLFAKSSYSILWPLLEHLLDGIANHLLVAIAALGVLTSSIVVARLFLPAQRQGRSSLRLESLPAPRIAYNYTLLKSITLSQRLTRCPTELRAGLIGAAVVILAWFAPGLVGKGDPITQRHLI